MLKNIIKKTVFVLLMSFIVISLCSCSNDSNADANIVESMKIYIFRNDKFLENAIWQYNSMYPGKKIVFINIDSLDEYRSRISSEIMAGEGPDIIYFDSYTIKNLYKIFQTGAFYDLPPFFKIR